VERVSERRRYVKPSGQLGRLFGAEFSNADLDVYFSGLHESMEWGQQEVCKLAQQGKEKEMLLPFCYDAGVVNSVAAPGCPASIFLCLSFVIQVVTFSPMSRSFREHSQIA
jgi:hypothetical protein